MSAKSLDAKHELRLRNLLKLPENKRCAVCDTQGPQYVVTDFNTFVCTVCSGVHRQFNHRCKGVSMATFKPDEMKQIELGGNKVAEQTYLAKWSPSDLPRPTDRHPSKVRDWIDAVYVKKRFYSPSGRRDTDSSKLGQASHASRATSEDIPSKPMSDLLGQDSVKLQVNAPVSEALLVGGAQQGVASGASDSLISFASPVKPGAPGLPPGQDGTAEPKQPAMKELPSDLFSEVQITAPAQLYSPGAALAGWAGPPGYAAQPSPSRHGVPKYPGSSGVLQTTSLGHVGVPREHHGGGLQHGLPTHQADPFAFGQPMPMNGVAQPIAFPSFGQPESSFAEASQPDPFSNLVPGLKSSLPILPTSPASLAAVPSSTMHAQPAWMQEASGPGQPLSYGQHASPYGQSFALVTASDGLDSADLSSADHQAAPKTGNPFA
ncbi:hypothetical protein WJX72_010505 [[Myrmecia] bisecta]|uniref:Arf-GAP domain-containing protein n=1 Tax=[Myrmecia] bisecta TaxID=41462 RepID=A0AAW1R932_9CHLO